MTQKTFTYAEAAEKLRNFLLRMNPLNSVLWDPVKDPKKVGQIWLIPINIVNPSDQIHCFDPTETEGYGGRILEFTEKTGKIMKFKGPWHSNSKALYEATGIDLRDRHASIGAVGRTRINGMEIGNLVYEDSSPIIGSFDRIRTLAKGLAEDLNSSLFYVIASSGGGSCGSVEP